MLLFCAVGGKRFSWFKLVFILFIVPISILGAYLLFTWTWRRFWFSGLFDFMLDYLKFICNGFKFICTLLSLAFGLLSWKFWLNIPFWNILFNLIISYNANIFLTFNFICWVQMLLYFRMLLSFTHLLSINMIILTILMFCLSNLWLLFSIPLLIILLIIVLMLFCRIFIFLWTPFVLAAHVLLRDLSRLMVDCTILLIIDKSSCLFYINVLIRVSFYLLIALLLISFYNFRFLKICSFIFNNSLLLININNNLYSAICIFIVLWISITPFTLNVFLSTVAVWFTRYLLRTKFLLFWFGIYLKFCYWLRSLDSWNRGTPWLRFCLYSVWRYLDLILLDLSWVIVTMILVLKSFSITAWIISILWFASIFIISRNFSLFLH